MRSEWLLHAKNIDNSSLLTSPEKLTLHYNPSDRPPINLKTRNSHHRLALHFKLPTFLALRHNRRFINHFQKRSATGPRSIIPSHLSLETAIKRAPSAKVNGVSIVKRIVKRYLNSFNDQTSVWLRFGGRFSVFLLSSVVYLFIEMCLCAGCHLAPFRTHLC